MCYSSNHCWKPGLTMLGTIPRYSVQLDGSVNILTSLHLFNVDCIILYLHIILNIHNNDPLTHKNHPGQTFLLNILDSIGSFWINEILRKNFERNTSLIHFLFHVISYVGELWTYLHCYHKNGNKKCLRQCAKLQYLGEGDCDYFDCDYCDHCYGGKVKSHPTS